MPRSTNSAAPRSIFEVPLMHNAFSHGWLANNRFTMGKVEVW